MPSSCFLDLSSNQICGRQYQPTLGPVLALLQSMAKKLPESCQLVVIPYL